MVGLIKIWDDHQSPCTSLVMCLYLLPYQTGEDKDALLLAAVLPIDPGLGGGAAAGDALVVAEEAEHE